MRSATILTTAAAAAIAMASDTASASSPHRGNLAAVAPKPPPPQQQQAEELWYPEFGTDYESGRCTTTPSPALATFAAGGGAAVASSTLADADREGCCETWFPGQELCGCLGGCAAAAAEGEIDEESSSSKVNASSGRTLVSEEGQEGDEDNYWYPKFDLTYEAGSCVKAGVNAPRGPPSYYMTESGFLHDTLDSCCELWFRHQEDRGCLSMGGASSEESAMARHAPESMRSAKNRTGSVRPRGGIGSGAYESARSVLSAKESTR